MLILLMETAMHILWIGLFYGIRKRGGCFLTLLHITACLASHTFVLNCNVIYAVVREIKIPKHVAEVCYLSV